VHDRLTYSLIHGITDFLTGDLDEILASTKDPVSIIEGPLMEGMDRVGELFGSGKMFLPQVVKSARVMSKAVSHLRPALQQAGATGDSLNKKGKILLATVKGDVHDIGKNLVGIMMLKHFQLKGHKPVALVGGATGMIGDPSGKSQERNLLDEQTLRANQECIKKQLSHFLDFNPELPNAAIMVNNYDWMKDYSFLNFIRDIGKHLTVNYMMAKDSVRNRLGTDSNTGMSFTEFSYQLVQGYDFLYLYQTINCKLQMGGSDQWGNIITGTELIRRKTGGEAFALTSPLITKSDGGKLRTIIIVVINPSR